MTMASDTDIEMDGEVSIEMGDDVDDEIVVGGDDSDTEVHVHVEATTDARSSNPPTFRRCSSMLVVRQSVNQ